MMPNKTIDRSLIDRIRLRARELPGSDQQREAADGRDLAVTRTGSRRLRGGERSKEPEPVGAK